MIQANELRIGNKVKSPIIQGRIATVEGILPGKAIIVDGTGTGENLEGVPLTPEILEACGFERLDTYDWHVGDFKIHGRKDSPDYLIVVGTRLYWHNQFNYLHQLQNLYFALTGTELTINLEKVKV